MDKPDLIITADEARGILVNLCAGFAFARFVIETNGANEAYLDYLRENLAARDLLLKGLGVR